jgi:AraC family transcriptional regulator, arabinose operon regulatory protein
MAGTIRGSRGTGLLRSRVLGQWAFIFVVEGEGLYRDVLGTEREIKAGHWILVFPEIGHCYGPQAGGAWSEFYLCFHGPLFDLWRENGLLSPRNPVGHGGAPDQVWPRINRLLGEMTDVRSKPQEALSRWQLFLLQTCSAAAPSLPGISDPRLRKVCVLIEENAANSDPCWEDICRQAGVGYENLRRLFRVHLQISPFRYREQRRIEKAIFLAQKQKFPAKKVAELLGYYDEAHFSKAFRRATGKTFSQYAASGRWE